MMWKVLYYAFRDEGWSNEISRIFNAALFFLFPSRWSPHSVYFVLWAALQGNSWVWQIVSNGKRHAEFRLSIVCFYRMSFVYEGDCIETYKWKTLSLFSSLIPSNPSRYVLQFFFVHSSCCRVAQFQLRMKITWKTFNFLSANVCVEFSLQVSTRLTCWNLQVKLEGKSTLLAAEIDSCTFSVVCAARVISNFFPLLFIIVLNKQKFLHFSEASREEKSWAKIFHFSMILDDCTLWLMKKLKKLHLLSQHRRVSSSFEYESWINFIWME